MIRVPLRFGTHNPGIDFVRELAVYQGLLVDLLKTDTVTKKEEKNGR